MNNSDYADNQVKGFRRYVPTKTAWSLLGAIGTVPFLVYKICLSYPIFNKVIFNQTILISIILALITSTVIMVLLIFELIAVINQSKHRRIVQYSNVHPLLSFKWLINNAKASHWIFLIVLSVISFMLGFYIN